MEIAIIVYVIGLVVTFAGLRVYEVTVLSKRVIYESDFGELLLLSVFWPLTWLYILIVLIF